MTRGLAIRAVSLTALVAAAAGLPALNSVAADTPRFQGTSLVQPAGYDEWPLAGASLGLSYSPSGGNGRQTFNRVYVNPTSYRTFLRDGAFPEGTTFVLELYEPADQVALPARAGRYEGRRVGLEASVKDSKRFDGGWAYFSFDNGRAATAPPFEPSRCQACHARHAAADNVFVQFYPRLRDVRRAGR
jgi:Cytochrome P460